MVLQLATKLFAGFTYCTYLEDLVQTVTSPYEIQIQFCFRFSSTACFLHESSVCVNVHLCILFTLPVICRVTFPTSNRTLQSNTFLFCFHLILQVYRISKECYFFKHGSICCKPTQPTHQVYSNQYTVQLVHCMCTSYLGESGGTSNTFMFFKHTFIIQ